VVKLLTAESAKTAEILILVIPAEAGIHILFFLCELSGLCGKN
jgi:hypothetical protein